MNVYWKTLVCSLALTVASVTFAANPYLPDDDNEVLETLPRELLASRGELDELRQLLEIDRQNLPVAAQVASRYLALGKQESDPRYYGYARASLAPWWDHADPPPEILALRAKLQERDHNYELALADLKLLLEKEPKNVQAWIELANIYRVQGKYDESQEACLALSQFADGAQSIFCSVPLQIATYNAEAAYAALEMLLPEAEERYPSTVPWVLTMQADAALALGRAEEAEHHFRAGLEVDPQDYYLLRAYADFLLDHDRAAEALELLREHTNDIGILLRAAIAAQRCGETALAKQWRTQLENHFEEVRLRGSLPHGRFEARWALELKKDPSLALTLAMANWEKQKETDDTRIALEAALAADDPAAVRPVLDFLAQHDTQNATLRKLAQQLERK